MAIFTQIVPLAGALWSFNIPGGALSGMVGRLHGNSPVVFSLFVFIWLHQDLLASREASFSCGMPTLSVGMSDLVHQPEIKVGLLPWEPGALASGPPGKSQPPLPTPVVKRAGDAST